MTSRTHPGSGDDDAPSLEERPDDPNFDELRKILLGPEFAALDDLTSRIDESSRFAEDVARVLPEAIVRRSARDERLAGALTPTIEEAVRTSVRKDSHVLVDALFPVMGPAIRKAVAAALGEMIQSLNRTLENSFSIKGLRWRMEAARTGKSFAEVALLHSLVYRVEQVILIHTETGLLVQHVVAPAVDAPEPELFSGMLTAIQDFLRDTIGGPGGGAGEGLNSLNYGSQALWFARGPQAVVVGILRGTAPEDLRTAFETAIESVHRDYGGSLERFDGDNAPFEGARPFLEECFQARYETEEKKPSPVLLGVVAAVLLLLIGWGVYAWWQSHTWNNYVASLKAQPGIVVTDEGTSGGKYFVAGMKDPLAKDPVSLLADAGIDHDDIVFRWEPYHSFQPEFLVERAKPLLAPPSTVQLSAANGGLVATGSAPHAWIVEARRLVKTMPGVTGLDERGLTDTDFADLMAEKGRLESIELRFISDSTALVAGQEAALKTLEETITELRAIAKKRGVHSKIDILGHTDSTGTEATNARLSEQRAAALIDYLKSRGIDTSDIRPYGVATAQPLAEEKTPDDAARNRSVTFKVSIEDQEP